MFVSICLQTFLTSERCFQSLSLRGIIRVWCHKEIPRILNFLTREGHVNTGFVTNMPRPLPFPPNTNARSNNVVIVGAGPAGLAAAYHLRNFGYNVCLSIGELGSTYNVLYGQYFLLKLSPLYSTQKVLSILHIKNSINLKWSLFL